MAQKLRKKMIVFFWEIQNDFKYFNVFFENVQDKINLWHLIIIYVNFVK